MRIMMGPPYDGGGAQSANMTENDDPPSPRAYHGGSGQLHRAAEQKEPPASRQHLLPAGRELTEVCRQAGRGIIQTGLTRRTAGKSRCFAPSSAAPGIPGGLSIRSGSVPCRPTNSFGDYQPPGKLYPSPQKQSSRPWRRFLFQHTNVVSIDRRSKPHHRREAPPSITAWRPVFPGLVA